LKNAAVGKRGGGVTAVDKRLLCFVRQDEMTEKIEVKEVRSQRRRGVASTAEAE